MRFFDGFSDRFDIQVDHRFPNSSFKGLPISFYEDLDILSLLYGPSKAVEQSEGLGPCSYLTPAS